jgi:hypothetical protein
LVGASVMIRRVLCGSIAAANASRSSGGTTLWRTPNFVSVVRKNCRVRR